MGNAQGDSAFLQYWPGCCNSEVQLVADYIEVQPLAVSLGKSESGIVACKDVVLSDPITAGALDNISVIFLRGAQHLFKVMEPTGKQQILPPQDKGVRGYYKFPHAKGLAVPAQDEDDRRKQIYHTLDRIFYELFLVKGFNLYPWGDNKPVFFEDASQAIITLHGLNIVPKLSEFRDWCSDEDLTVVAFSGFGMRLLQGTADGFEVDCSFLVDAEVREGFERLGATAYFDKQGKIKKIFWAHGSKEVGPMDDEWNHAKWAFKCSLTALEAVVVHLVQLHWLVANTCLIATIEKLSPEHPLRRVLKPFLFETGWINSLSLRAISPAGSLVVRNTPFTNEAWYMLLENTYNSFRYKPLPEFISGKQLGEMESKVPMATDGLKCWGALNKFFAHTVGVLYGSDEKVLADQELVSFWACVEARGEQGSTHPYGLPELSFDTLVTYLTDFAWTVTAHHAMIGDILEYLYHPGAFGTKVRPDVEVADVQSYLTNLAQYTFTSVPHPKLMSDWAPLLPENVQHLHGELVADLQKISDEIQDLNRKAPSSERLVSYSLLDPQTFDCAICR